MFSASDIRRISQAIAEAERRTSGEIRVHVEMRPQGQALDQARRVFLRLKMNRTKDRNGVLLFLSPRTRTIAIVGDAGIHEKVQTGFWDETRDLILAQFRAGRFLEGVIAGIHKAAESLSAYFPRHPDDVDELSNDVSLSKDEKPDLRG